MVDEIVHTHVSFLNRKFLSHLPYHELAEKSKILKNGLQDAYEHHDITSIKHLESWILEVEEAMQMIDKKDCN